MLLSPGMILGQYEIRAPLGAGGMGEVYRAHDMRLGREVAIKILPGFASSDPERLRRFEQEAMAAAALNHPNILAVFQMGTHEGAPYLVSELLEGGTLGELIKRGRIPLRKAIEYGAQIAHGLAAAHEKGIWHRDLKPENLFVTKDGRAKILDFGLAKLTQPHPNSAHSAQTVGSATEPGMVMGTVGYMSPEQVRGDTADHRTDIFAFGAILYEMLTGQRAFQKPTSVETMTAILNEEPPPISQVDRQIPAGLQRVVRRCLEKDFEQRFQSASDLAFALEALSDSEVASTGIVAKSRSGLRLKGILAISATALIIVIVIAYLLRPELPPPRITGFTQLTHDGHQKNFYGQVATIVLTDGPRLYVQENIDGRFVVSQVSASGGETVPLPLPFPNVDLDSISQDKSELIIGSFTGYEVDQPLWAIPILGGSPRRLGEMTAEDAAWTPNRDLLIAHGTQLMVVGGGGTTRKFADVDGAAYWFRFSPDDRVLRYTLGDLGFTGISLWESSLADGSHPHQLLAGWNTAHDPANGNWTPDGHYFLFQAVRNGRTDIWAIPEKEDLFHKPKHDPVQLTAGPMSFYSPQPSSDGKKVFVVGEQPRAELVRYDAKSGQFVPYLGGISAGHVAFSRDGQWVAYTSYPEGNLWRSRTDGSEKLQLTSAPIFAMLPVWSPDGKEIAFLNLEPGREQQIHVIPANGGVPRELAATQFEPWRLSWAPDGHSIVFGDFIGPESSYTFSLSALWIRSVDINSLKVSTIPESEHMLWPSLSPDGRYVVAASIDAQKLMLFDLETQKWSQLADSSIGFPQWSADSKYVYFDSGYSAEPTISRVRVADRKLEHVASFAGLRRVITPWISWSGVTPDGSPLLMRDIGAQEVYALDFEAP